MAGLGMAFAGALAGAGEGISQQAQLDTKALLEEKKAQRAMRLQELGWAREDAQLAQARDWQLEDKAADRALATQQAAATAAAKRSTLVTGDEASAMGLDPTKAYNVGPNGKVSAIGGSSTNINVNTGDQGLPGLGKVPQGYSYVYGDDGQVVRDERGVPKVAPLQGGEADKDAQEAGAKKARSNETKVRAADVVMTDIGRMRDMIKGGRLQPITGITGAVAGLIPGTEASDARALAMTIRGNVGFDRLQQMRENSPTGGALGNVTEQELATLQSVLGSLEFSQSKKQLLENLNRLESLYQQVMEKASAYPNASQFGFAGSGPSAPRGPAVGTEKRGYRFKGGDPSDQSNWEVI